MTLDPLLRPKSKDSIVNDLWSDMTLWRILNIIFNLRNVILNNFGIFLTKLFKVILV